MLHQTLAISSSSSSSSSSFPLTSSSSFSSPPPLSLSDCSQVEEETGMEEMVWAVENGSVFGEEFSVDDLLNLEFAENEKEEEEEEEEAEHKEPEESSSGSPSSSSLSSEPPLKHSGISLPAHDAEELEWVSLIMDDSLSEFPPCPGVAPLPSAPRSQDETEAQTENRRIAYATKGHSFVSPTLCILSTEAMVPVKAKRSKRSRTAAAAWSMSGPLPYAESSSDSTTTTTTSSSLSSCSSLATTSNTASHRPSAAAGDQSFLLFGIPPPAKKQKPKKRGRKPKAPSPSATAGERRCTHCGAQKTPQWRAGPLGSKTLCNACGVRFKSGRLLPEYRPACSPTFVSHIHSNCHRKVLEMRRKKEAQFPSAAAWPAPSS